MEKQSDIKECCQESQQVFKDLSEELMEKLKAANQAIERKDAIIAKQLEATSASREYITRISKENERLKFDAAMLTLSLEESQKFNWITAQESEYCTETGLFEVDEMNALSDLCERYIKKLKEFK